MTDSGWEQFDESNPNKPADLDGEHLNFGNIGEDAPVIHELGPNALRQDGIRISKWEHELGATDNMSNDWAVFRYADILLVKAEAVWRKSQSPTDATALALVNQIRDRAGVDPLTTLDGPLSFDMEGGSVPGGELFNERGREMFAEHDRRRDLIRWGFWTDVEKWGLPANNPGDAYNSAEYTELFPIPRPRIDANPNLEQNPGY